MKQIQGKLILELLRVQVIGNQLYTICIRGRSRASVASVAPLTPTSSCLYLSCSWWACPLPLPPLGTHTFDTDNPPFRKSWICPWNVREGLRYLIFLHVSPSLMVTWKKLEGLCCIVDCIQDHYDHLSCKFNCSHLYDLNSLLTTFNRS